MEAGVERTVGTARLSIHMLGPFTVQRDGAEVALPASRKVRALFAYLALSPNAVPRARLCDLLWELPNDPRGELRWCLSKIRGLIDDPDHRHVEAHGDDVRLDLSDCYVDAREVERSTQTGEEIDIERLRELERLFEGDFLDGLSVDDSPLFEGWLIAQRRRFRARHTALLERLVKSSAGDEMLVHLERWIELAPFDHRAHELMLAALATRERFHEGEEHLAATSRLFEVEGIDAAALREAWRVARSPTARALAAAEPPSEREAVADRARRASVAVMPFVDASSHDATGGGAAGGLAHDVITRLAKLRGVLVIAQGTVFALHERGIGAHEAARMMNVDYVVSGTYRRRDDRLTVTVELTETRTARIVWADELEYVADGAFAAIDTIGDRIVVTVASEIEASERNRAVLKPPNSLDAWEAHHRGLWHMYRFNRHDNETARTFFEMAVRLDPTFARAYAGLSFTYFQDAFQSWNERARAIDCAFESGAQSLMVDDRDPAAHWAMGRAMWLRGSFDESIAELQRSTELSPNFALGHYTLAFVHSQNGDPAAAIAASDHSRLLSPFDPLLFGMLGSRAMALMRLGRFDEAADWGMKAAARPNAHAHILAIAALSLALADRF